MFIKGKVYIRREIHQQFGGQAQSGISTPSQHNLIFIFTGAQGAEYGYHDQWAVDGVFQYTGEGQKGDMAFSKGNKAIRDHINTGEDIHLFEYVDMGRVRYINQMVCVGYQWKMAKDVNNDLRKVIVFELAPVDAFFSYGDQTELKPYAEKSLLAIREEALGFNPEETQPEVGLKRAYRRSEALTAYAIRRANNKCEACGADAPFITPDGTPYLEIHDLRRESDGGPGHPGWVAALCPNCHRRAHYSNDKVVFNADLMNKISDKESLFK